MRTMPRTPIMSGDHFGGAEHQVGAPRRSRDSMSISSTPLRRYQPSGPWRTSSGSWATRPGSRLLTLLTEGGHNVGEICEALGGQSQPAVSHHLALLRLSGLVSPSREGKFNFYELTEQGRTLTQAVGWFGPPDGAGATALFRQASDPTRLQILLILSERDRNVCELCSDLGGQSQPAVSHHLALLRNGGLIEATTGGKFSYYSLRAEGRELIG